MLKVKIITPQREILSRDVESVTCNTIDGEITILPRHTALLTLLSEGVIKVKDKDKEEYFSAGSGYIETDGREIHILISRAAGQGELDERKILEVEAEAKRLLGEHRDESERKKAFAMLKRSTIDLKVIKKLKRIS